MPSPRQITTAASWHEWPRDLTGRNSSGTGKKRQWRGVSGNSPRHSRWDWAHYINCAYEREKWRAEKLADSPSESLRTSDVLYVYITSGGRLWRWTDGTREVCLRGPWSLRLFLIRCLAARGEGWKSERRFLFFLGCLDYSIFDIVRWRLIRTGGLLWACTLEWRSGNRNGRAESDGDVCLEDGIHWHCVHWLSKSHINMGVYANCMNIGCKVKRSHTIASIFSRPSPQN